MASGGLETIWKQWMFLSLPISTGRRQLLRSDVSVRWGYEVRVIRQRSVITGQCWEVHSYSWVDRDHSRDCDGKGNWETSQTNSTDGEKKAHNCK